MRVKIKSISIQNFKGCREEKFSFSDLTKFFGANATGKTTVFDAFTWALFGKDSLGSEKFNIRPLNKDGSLIDNVEIKVVVVLDVDGGEVELSKTQKQKWVKKRGSSTETFQGNENLYEIDGYPKTEKDYKERISEIIGEELFKMITSPTYFTSLKWKEQRDILMKFIKEISDLDLAGEDIRFTELIEEIRKAPSLDDILKKYQKSLSGWKKQQIEIPVRIDEAERQKVDIDFAELELAKKDVEKLILQNQEKQDDVLKQLEEYQKLTDDILDIKFAMSDLERKANEKNIELRRGLENQIYCVERNIIDKKSSVKNMQEHIQSQEKSLEILQCDLEKARNDYKQLSDMKINENSLICSMCGQAYPNDKAEELKSDFETRRKKNLAEVVARGNSINAQVKQKRDAIELERQDVIDCQKQEQSLQAELVNLKNELGKLPSIIDVSNTEEYVQLKIKLEEKESVLQKSSDANSIKNELKKDRIQLENNLRQVELELSKTELNAKLDERIEELQQEQRNVAQKVADQEKMIYLLEEFIRYKMDKISEIINSKFDGIRFKLFENQINGGLKECCECTVNGVPYSSLNNGHRIVAGIKIIKALQELYGVSAPIFIDNAESINEFNIPKMDGQLILMSVSADKRLRVEVE